MSLGALLALCAPPLAAAAQGAPRVVTERDVLAAVLASDPEVIAARAAVSSSRAREAGEGLYPNPTLSWDREHVPGAGPASSREDMFALSVPIQLGGARGAQRALAESATAELRAEQHLTASQAAHDALASFYEALAAREHIAIASAQLERLSEAERVLARRLAEGSASGYAHTRLLLEAELAESALREREAKAAAAIAELVLLLGLPSEDIELRGDLELHEPPTPSEPRASLLHLRAAQRAAERARQGASTAWIPAIKLQGGPKLAAAGGETGIGYVAGATLELPLLDTKGALGTEARARAAELDARGAARARAAERSTRRAAIALRLMRAEQLRFEQATRERINELERAAQSAYREGMQTILELLDAQRMRTAIEERLLALRLEAKRAELALRAARGELEGRFR